MKAVCLVGVCLERDAGVTKMGGEPTRTLAFEKMHKKATAFFSSLLGDKGRHLLTGPNLWHSDRIGNLHTALYDFASGSRLQLVGTPLTLLYEEGSSDGFLASSNFLSKTILTVGQLSVREILPGQSQPLIKLLEFIPRSREQTLTTPDLKVVIRETLKEGGGTGESRTTTSTVSSTEVILNPCQIDFDPGIIDRTYMLANYRELDPDCLSVSKTPEEGGQPKNTQQPSSGKVSDLKIKVRSTYVGLTFRVPKVDMRKPSDMSGMSEFVEAFWTRSVHPEVYELCLTDLELDVTQDAPAVSIGRLAQVWSLTQFYSVDFSQSRIGVKKRVFNIAQSRFASGSCC